MNVSLLRMLRRQPKFTPPPSRWFPVEKVCDSGWYWVRNPVYPECRDRIVYLSEEMIKSISKTLPGSSFQRVADAQP